MRILFDGTAWVSYSQIYVTSDEVPDLCEAFAGQSNGMCGAATPGVLFLTTGTHSGGVRFTVELHDQQPPPPAEEWQDVVEVSFVPDEPAVDLLQWSESSAARLELADAGTDPGDLTAFRVQYCATGMDLGRDPFGGIDPDVLADGDTSYRDHRPDRYLLRFWPDGTGQPRPDAVLRHTSSAATYWHDWARQLPPPPAAEERAEAERREQEAQQRRLEERRLREEAGMWGGRPPGERLRQVGGNIHQLVRYDRDLVDDIVEASAATQRRIALWAARCAYTRAGIMDLEWLIPAWTALDRGEPVPVDCTDPTAMLERIDGEARVPSAKDSVGYVGSLRYEPFYQALWPKPPEPRDLVVAMLRMPADPVPMALPALPAAAGPDPLQAALEAVWYALATYGPQAETFVAELRRAFPVIDQDGPPR